MQISGPSESGKSRFILDLIKYREVVFDKKFQRIIYACPDNFNLDRHNYCLTLQQLFPDMEIITKLPNVSDIVAEDSKHTLFIVDDMAVEFLNNKAVLQLFFQFSHHENISLGDVLVGLRIILLACCLKKP
jgi:hypothetical protein